MPLKGWIHLHNISSSIQHQISHFPSTNGLFSFLWATDDATGRWDIVALVLIILHYTILNLILALPCWIPLTFILLAPGCLDSIIQLPQLYPWTAPLRIVIQGRSYVRWFLSKWAYLITDREAQYLSTTPIRIWGWTLAIQLRDSREANLLMIQIAIILHPWEMDVSETINVYNAQEGT